MLPWRPPRLAWTLATTMKRGSETIPHGSPPWHPHGIDFTISKIVEMGLGIDEWWEARFTFRAEQKLKFEARSAELGARRSASSIRCSVSVDLAFALLPYM